MVIDLYICLSYAYLPAIVERTKYMVNTSRCKVSKFPDLDARQKKKAALPRTGFFDVFLACVQRAGTETSTSISVFFLLLNTPP